MPALRSLLYAAIFYPGTVLWVLTGLVATLIGRKPTLKVVLSWAGSITGLRSTSSAFGCGSKAVFRPARC